MQEAPLLAIGNGASESESTAKNYFFAKKSFRELKSALRQKKLRHRQQNAGNTQQNAIHA